MADINVTPLVDVMLVLLIIFMITAPMMTQGVDPQLDIRDIERIKGVYEYSNQLRIPERHPYVGELVYTAFSGSHQDAINKGMKALEKANKTLWEVPYLPIDPQDVGRSYEAIIRINSQSGKGGVAYVMETDYGLKLPRNLQVEMRNDVQRITDEEGKELRSSAIHARFMERYVDQPTGRLRYIDHATFTDPDSSGRMVEVTITDNGETRVIKGRGNGPVDGFVAALNSNFGTNISVADYSEHSLQQGSDATAICYMDVQDGESGHRWFGAGINANIVAASLEALVSAVNRKLADDI